ncbi:MAG: phasin [Variibacter sp.]|nr:phasin [Variibacter sp.]
MAQQFAKAPGFEFPRFEFPTAYRDVAEKGIAQAKQNYERVRAAAEGATDLVETTLTTATKGISEYNLKLIEAMRANVNAHFDFAASLFAVKSPSEAVELSSAHARKQFETLSAQGKELASLAQKVSTETVEPIKTGFNKALRLVA